jgi:leucine-zipper of insertion element IS481
MAGERGRVEPTAAFAHRQLRFTDQTPRRSEVIRPLLLSEDRTATQRAQETETHPDTVRTLRRRFRHQGMLGLLPDRVEVSPRGRVSRVPEAVRQEIARLKALYRGCHDREVVRMIFSTTGYRLHPNTVKRLRQQDRPAVPGAFTLRDYHGQQDRYQARVQVMKLYDQGWPTLSISRVLHVSRPPVDRGMARFEAEHLAGLADQSSAPKSPTRKVWLPLMLEVDSPPKASPRCRRVPDLEPAGTDGHIRPHGRADHGPQPAAL